MSPIAIGLDGLLILLLLITFTLGLRVERRLKGLRADHAGFAKAVAELDQALQRADEGLRDLRTAGTQAQTMLASRIQEARAAAARLDELTAKAVLTPQALSRPTGEPAVLELARAVARPLPASEAAAPAPRPTVEDAPVQLEARRDTRSRARVDEDLFEVVDEAFPRLKFAAGGRR